jgi:hypothetical protein
MRDFELYQLEAVNATIQWVKKTARGFRNVEHSCLPAGRSRLRSTFDCGRLDLYPTNTKA